MSALKKDVCYAHSLGNCAGALSREHYISRMTLENFCGGQMMNAVGIDPRNPTTRSPVSVSSLTASILCAKHNALLSPLDEAGGSLSRVLFKSREALLNVGETIAHEFDGRTLERWFLKILCGLLARAKMIVPEGWVRVLFGKGELTPPRGLYVYTSKGDALDGQDLSVTELKSSVHGLPTGITVRLKEFEFVLSMAPTLVVREARHIGKIAIRRPAGLELQCPELSSALMIDFAWDDGDPRRILSSWSMQLSR